jgi:hypothetical protein
MFLKGAYGVPGTIALELLFWFGNGTGGFAAVSVRTAGPDRVISGSVSALYCTSMTWEVRVETSELTGSKDG